MIYSQWRPDGGYDYFETPERRNLGDDLPQPQLPGAAGGIGVPAQECGRELPAGARSVGRGDLPQGLIVPAPGGVTGLSGLDSTFGGATVRLVAFGLATVLGYYYVAPWLRRHT
jgi:hypothetical protein